MLRTFGDVLTFAIRREHDAHDLYMMFSSLVKDTGAKALLEDLARQEAGHMQQLEGLLTRKGIEGIEGKKDARVLHLEDYMLKGEIGPESTPQQVMLYAIKKEQESYNMYHLLEVNYEMTEVEVLFASLAEQELHHKEILEREYEEHFMKWM